jgi:hypothetical protein
MPAKGSQIIWLPFFSRMYDWVTHPFLRIEITF